jgi:signal transduction histidine kinase
LAQQNTNWVYEATNHLGQWIWDTNTTDKQMCQFWKSFRIPPGAKISGAILRITVDNAYTLFLDGQEIGRGGDWRTVTEYDVTRLLSPGRHIIGVEAFNDRLQAGLIFGLHIQLASEEASAIDIYSDNTWWVVPDRQPSWFSRKTIQRDWHQAIVIGMIGQPPWQVWPYGVTMVPALRPVVVRFWQTGWFELTLVALCLLAVGISLGLMTRLAAQAKAQALLQLERIRIARDIHDDLGAQLTQLLLLGEVARREQPEHSPVREQFTQICNRARELAQAMDEVVWAVNARRDTVRDFSNYVCKYAQLFLAATNIHCRLDVEPEIPATLFDLPVRRNLFLAVKEALTNAAKYSQADELFLRIARRNHELSVVVEDLGRGFDPEQSGGDRNGLTNMAQRMADIGGKCEVFSQPGHGCRLTFSVPLPNEHRRWFRRMNLTTPTQNELNPPVQFPQNRA